MNGSKRIIGSDLSRVDAHVATPEEYQEVPELDADFFEAADYFEAGKLVRRGRPPAANRKIPISIRLSEDVLNRFKASGAGWQTRIDVALREWLDRHPGRI